MRFLGYTLGDECVPVPPPSPELMEKMGSFMEEATTAGVIVATGGIAPTAMGAKISLKDGEFTVVDGPFTETKEAVGGYLVLQADSFEEAVEVARTNPVLRYGVTVEVRPILAECPIFARHPEIVRRAKEHAVSAEERWATMAA